MSTETDETTPAAQRPGVVSRRPRRLAVQVAVAVDQERVGAQVVADGDGTEDLVDGTVGAAPRSQRANSDPLGSQM